MWVKSPSEKGWEVIAQYVKQTNDQWIEKREKIFPLAPKKEEKKSTYFGYLIISSKKKNNGIK